MKIIAIDIETTGLDPDECQVLEVAAIPFDSCTGEIFPSFHSLIHHDKIRGEPFALSMHSGILRSLEDQGTSEWDFVVAFHSWLREHVTIRGGVACPTFAGKNVGAFDLQFLKRMDGWAGHIKPKHRTFDPAILYFDPLVDTDLPSIDECCKRAGLLDLRSDDKTNSLTSKHDAMGDAMIVVQLLMKKWANLPRWS